MEMVNKIPVHDKKDKYLKRKIERAEFHKTRIQFGVNKKHSIREKKKTAKRTDILAQIQTMF